MNAEALAAGQRPLCSGLWAGCWRTRSGWRNWAIPTDEGPHRLAAGPGASVLVTRSSCLRLVKSVAGLEMAFLEFLKLHAVRTVGSVQAKPRALCFSVASIRAEVQARITSVVSELINLMAG